jgi:hypothetical protein
MVNCKVEVKHGIFHCGLNATFLTRTTFCNLSPTLFIPFVGSFLSDLMICHLTPFLLTPFPLSFVGHFYDLSLTAFFRARRVLYFVIPSRARSLTEQSREMADVASLDTSLPLRMTKRRRS